MLLFTTLLVKLIPLMLFVVLGYLGGRFLGVKKEAIAPLLIYLILPFIVFNGVATSALSWQYISLPFFFLLLCSTIALLFLALGRLFWKDVTSNILAFAAGTGNSGYFGLPVISIILGPSFLNLAVFGILGFTLFENTLGFFIVARGKHSLKESLLRIARLPTIYAFLAGLVSNLSGFKPTSIDIYVSAMPTFTGAYVLLGMMLIGLGMADVRLSAFDLRFLSFTFLAKFLVWPLLIFLFIALDTHVLHFYSPDIQKYMIFMGLIPLAANTVSYATLLHAHPEKAALAVLFSTLFALFFIPLVLSLSGLG